VYPWGGREVLIGIAGFALVFFFVNAVVVGSTFWSDYEPRDVGDIFEKASVVARYADERLAAAAREQPLPSPPRVLANQTSLRVGLLVTLLSQGLLFFVVGVSSKQSFTGLVRAVGLVRYQLGTVWRPILAVAGAYTMVGLYIAAAKATGVGWLEPESTVPVEIARDHLTLAIAGAATVVGAPISEELYFRGLIFSGLSKWGFWPAAAISAALFTLVHFDTGSIIPFFIIGLIMAALYWSRGSLWDSIIFHFLFNLTSFTILAATA
jgi:membrane protease YdiL (CAAX protease family)